jgi:hypothetical protein
MARESGDAVGIKPKFVPNDELLARDDSGGPEYQPYTGAFGDGGYVTGEKGHLSAHGGSENEEEGDEIASTESARNKNVSPKSPGRSRKEQAE